MKAFTIFQFTPLREGRLTESTISCATENFNSRPSARGDLNPPPPRAAVPLFQFTPLREGRPCRFACCFLAFCISIHAPPRGATTRARRAHPPMCYFNSRPSARGDSREAKISRENMVISIHAPPRGATYTRITAVKPGKFQFTPLREGRLSVMSPEPYTVIFQFTPLREGRPASISRTTHSATFQFTPLREGRRALQNQRPSLATHFNSRPSARGDSQTQ